MRIADEITSYARRRLGLNDGGLMLVKSLEFVSWRTS